MIAIIGSTYRLLSNLISATASSRIDTVEDFIAFRGAVPHIKKGTYSDAVIVLSGSGSERSKVAIDWVLDEFSPSLVISVGYAGGVNPSAMPGDVVIGTNCGVLHGEPIEWRADQIQLLEMSSRAVTAARRAVEAASLDYHIGAVVSSSILARSVEMKRWLAESLRTQAIDEDAYEIALACSARAGIESMVARCIAETYDSEPLASYPRITSRPQSSPLATSALYAISQPAGILAFRRLIRNLNMGMDAITDFIPHFLHQWHTAK